jgi:hypothetical protein
MGELQQIIPPPSILSPNGAVVAFLRLVNITIITEEDTTVATTTIIITFITLIRIVII